MSGVEILSPVEGWNPVPANSDAMVWWDGSAFTHEAIRSEDGWEIGAVGESPTGSVEHPGPTHAVTPRPRERLARWRVGTLAWLALVVGLLWAEFAALVASAPDTEQTFTSGCPGWDPDPMLARADWSMAALLLVVVAGFVVSLVRARRTGVRPAGDRVVVWLRVLIALVSLLAVAANVFNSFLLVLLGMDCSL